MEKLIELLNEFLEENYPKKNLVKAIEDDYFVNNWNDGDGFLCETIMSKKFGFIQWLAEKEKIDYNKDKYGMNFFENGSQAFLTSADEVIMELSIQDEPIEFLVSILK